MARTRSRDRTSRHQLTVIGLVSVFVVMVAALLLCLVTFAKLKARAHELQTESLRLEQLSQKQQSELERKGDPDYIKKYARENLDLKEQQEEQFIAE